MDNEYIDIAQQHEDMAKEKKKRKTPPASPKSDKKPNAFIQILNGDFLSKGFILANLPFIFFLMFLLILNVGKSYYGKQLSHRLIEVQTELDELTGEYFETKARLEEQTNRSILLKRLVNRNVKETTIPTKVIRIQENDK